MIIPDSVTTIGDSAFSWCSSLTSVEIGDGITSIDEYAFCGCDSLTSVVMGDSVTTIGNNALRDCRSLTSVEIPDSVTTIGEYAFGEYTNLTSVYYKGTAEEWAGITINFSNGALTNATRYYYIENEADVPTDGGNYWHYDENGEIAVW